MATAVISSSEAMHYLHTLIPSVPVLGSTILLLLLFLLLTIAGLSESALIATIIFVIHLSTIAILILSGIWFVITKGFDIAIVNFRTPVDGSLFTAIVFGFSAAMLGISGFESSANFVENQMPGVFRKTLRNMWLAVTIINPLVAILAILVLPKLIIVQNQEALLSYLGFSTGGKWLSILISLDAFLVLSGAVLTSYVGVEGLMKRMALDRILPQFTLKTNKAGSSYRLLILFFLLCLSVLFATRGKLGALAGVYTISFLSVMAYFGVGNFLLKMKRSGLPRPVYASPIAVTIAIFAVVIALYGNVKMHPDYLVIFLQYFVPSIILIIMLLNRKALLKMSLVVIENFFDTIADWAQASHSKLSTLMIRLNNQQFVYFSKADSIASLNKVMRYVQDNETTSVLKIVTVLQNDEKVSEEYLEDIKVLDRAYPEISIEFTPINGSFNPELIKKLSNDWKIPINFMFIASPGDKFPYKVSELGGVRLII